jgi:uncharacterized NAD(P)/FAD-binding protein YdhS
VTSTPLSTAPTATTAIIGGGASGVLTAINLLARSADPDLRVTLHEATGIIGRGIAYGTNDPLHLLNVRSRHMSAFPDAPSDLIDWARRTGRSEDAQAFLPRQDYAAYLQDRLAEVADHRLSIRAGRVDDVARVGDGFEVRCERSVTTAANVVLAYGNLAPRTLVVDGDDLTDAPWHLRDPWDLGALRMLPRDATVVVVGTGLTAVDTAVTLLAEPGAADRKVVMVSRHGLLPRRHVEQQSTAWVTKVPSGPLTADRLAALFRDQVAAAREQGVGWRAVVDGLRAPTQDIWRRLALDERRRFLAEHARHWEVRRHRMAPEVAERLDSYVAAGRLEVRADTIDTVADRGDHAVVGFTRSGPPVAADALVNCTGPLTDVTRCGDPLLLAMRERGLLTPDPLLLGLASTPEGELLDEEGRLVPGLYAVGPPRKGTLYESTAIPEIRAQAAQVAGLVLGRVAKVRVPAVSSA